MLWCVWILFYDMNKSERMSYAGIVHLRAARAAILHSANFHNVQTICKNSRFSVFLAQRCQMLRGYFLASKTSNVFFLASRTTWISPFPYLFCLIIRNVCKLYGLRQNWQNIPVYQSDEPYFIGLIRELR